MTVRFAVASTLLLALAACSSTTSVSAPYKHAALRTNVAGPGDTVLTIPVRRPLPNVLGGNDIWGRTVDAGRITIRLIGAQGSRATFERADMAILSDETTLSRTPLLIPDNRTTSVSGTYNGKPFRGTLTEKSMRVIGQSHVNRAAIASEPVRFTLGIGEATMIGGKTLRVISVLRNSVTYSVN